MPSFTKQPYEAFSINVEFEKNMATGETISTANVFCKDMNGDTATSDIIGSTTINDTNIDAFIQNGSAALSPYKITFRAVTSDGNKWELDVTMRVVEDRDV